MDYRDFFGEAIHRATADALNLAVFGRLESVSGFSLAMICQGDLANLPPRPENLNFGSEQGLARYQQELPVVSAWSPERADAEAARVASRLAVLNQEYVDLAASHLAIAQQLTAVIVNWHPHSDDADVHLQLELFRAKLLVWLDGARDWAIKQFEMMTSSRQPMTGEEYKRQRIADIEASIAKERANITRMYAEARRELPFLHALRGELAAITSELH